MLVVFYADQCILLFSFQMHLKTISTNFGDDIQKSMDIFTVPSTIFTRALAF